MAAGKSTVGRQVAVRTGLPFIDVDEHIERRVGCSIAQLFKTRGESAFRQLESDALREIAVGAPAVVAAGGGTPCHHGNLSLMRSHGLVVTLDAPLEMLRERVSDTSTRPLLSLPGDELQSLYRARIPFYRQAHACVRTVGCSIASVAETVERLATAAEAIPRELLEAGTLVALARHAYPIMVAAGIQTRIGELVRRALGERCERIAVLSDNNVAPLYATAVVDGLQRAGFEASVWVVPAGEGSKSFREYERLCTALTRGNLDRHSALVALGGGVIGDLAGFVAATLFRGIACVQVPTSLLAMVDSSIGGKTGINVPAGKNLIGAFWQPRAVIADPAVLATLPTRERRAAFGELVKYGLLDGDALFSDIDRLAGTLIADDTWTHERHQNDNVRRVRLDDSVAIIKRCAAHKSWVVTRDEREQTGERALLNLGHTVGHAIEAAAGYGTILHGEAVALGLLATCRVSARLGMCGDDLYFAVEHTLKRAGLDVDLDPWLRDDVLSHLRVDKKRTGKHIGFIAVREPGLCERVELTIENLGGILR